MMFEIPRCVEKFLLREYAEFSDGRKDVSQEEEQIILARLVLAQQIDFFALNEYMDFSSFDKIKKKLYHGFKKTSIVLLTFSALVFYGLIQFIRKASEDEKMKPYVIIALCSLAEFCEPPSQLVMYYWESENMVKFINQYMTACKEISGHSRKFYKDLTIRRILFKCTVRHIAFGCMILHILKRSACSDKDLRFVCGLYVPMWLPIETNYFPVRELVQIMEILVTYRMLIITVHQSIDQYILTELFQYKIRHLIKFMQKTSLSRVQKLTIAKKKFHDIVDYHQEIYECFETIKSISSALLAPAITVCIPASAAVSVAFMRDFNLAQLQEFLLTVFAFYLCIYSIQRIIDLGELIEEEAYGMDWYEMDKKLYKEYLIFLMKLQKPLYIKSIFFILQMPFLLTVYRSVYSFFTLMLQMK